MSPMHQLPGPILAATTTMKGKMATSLLCAGGPLRQHEPDEVAGVLLPVLGAPVDEEGGAAVVECGVGAVRDAGDGQGGRPGHPVAIDSDVPCMSAIDRVHPESLLTARRPSLAASALWRWLLAHRRPR